MKVAFLAPMPLDLSSISSGVPRASLDLITSLKKYHSDISIDCISLSNEVKDVTKVNARFGDIYYVPTFKGRTALLYIPDIIKLKNLLRSLGPDVVHSQGFPEYILAGLFSSYPHVATLHGIITREAKTEIRPIKHFLRAIIRGMLERYYIRNLGDVIAISRYVETYVSAISKARIHSIGNPIDEKYFELEDKSSPGVILQVGSLVYRKGAHLLIEAISNLSHTRVTPEVHFAGATPDLNYVNQLLSLLKKNRLDDKVHIHGLINEKELLSLYSRASVICLPSFEETSPLSVAQGMAAKKVIVASDGGGIPDLVQEGKTGFLFPTGSSERLSIILREILNGKLPARRVGENAGIEALKRFHPKGVAEKTREVYRMLAKC